MEIKMIRHLLLMNGFFITDLARKMRCSEVYLCGVLKGRTKAGRGFNTRIEKALSELLFPHKPDIPHTESISEGLNSSLTPCHCSTRPENE